MERIREAVRLRLEEIILKLQREIDDYICAFVSDIGYDDISVSGCMNGFNRLRSHVAENMFPIADEEIEKRCGCSIKELISSKGDKYFRDLETEVIKDVSSKGCQVISTGGGAVLREENVTALKRNGKIFFINAVVIATD